MARKFLSILGTGDYKSCYYVNQDKEKVKTKFIQEALINFLCKDWDKDDKAIIFLTDKARQENWFNKNDESRRLKNILEKLNFSMGEISIPDGKNKDEIWEIYDKIFNSIEENDEIIFDITHSFRSIPMLFLVVLNYAKVVKNVKLKGIYYGAFEARTGEEENAEAPVFDLTAFDELLEWSQAVNIFLKYGNSSDLARISKQALMCDLKNRDEGACLIRDFIVNLDDFTNSIYTCRGKMDKEKNSTKKSIGFAYLAMNEKLDSLEKKHNYSLKPLMPLFNKIKERTEAFNKTDNLGIGMAVVKWSIDNNLIQQAYTALDETMKTFLCVKFKLDDTDCNCREKIAAKALRIKSKNMDKSQWIIDEEYRDKITYIVENTDKEIGLIAKEVSELRNDINHFGFKDNCSKYTNLNKKIESLYKKFVQYVRIQEI